MSEEEDKMLYGSQYTQHCPDIPDKTNKFKARMCSTITQKGNTFKNNEPPNEAIIKKLSSHKRKVVKLKKPSTTTPQDRKPYTISDQQENENTTKIDPNSEYLLRLIKQNQILEGRYEKAARKYDQTLEQNKAMRQTIEAIRKDKFIFLYICSKYEGIIKQSQNECKENQTAALNNASTMHIHNSQKAVPIKAKHKPLSPRVESVKPSFVKSAKAGISKSNDKITISDECSQIKSLTNQTPEKLLENYEKTESQVMNFNRILI